MESKKCIHNRPTDFCCECRYGKIREAKNPHVRDAVDDLKAIGVGYKLLVGHFGDIPEEKVG